MRGSHPYKHPATLVGHRPSRPLTRIGPVEGLAPPRAPRGLSAPVRRLWGELWTSRVGSSWDRASDLPAMLRYIHNLERYLRYGELVTQMPMVKGSTGQLRANPLAARMDALEGQLRTAEEQYGLSPLARVRLGIELVKGESAGSTLEERLTRRRRAQEREDGTLPGTVTARVIDLDG